MASRTAQPFGGRRLLLAADAFLFAAALGVSITAAVAEITRIMYGGPVAAGAFGPVMTIALDFATMVAPVLAGAALAWWLRGRRIGLIAAVGGVAGALAGGAISTAVFGGGALLLRQLPVERNAPPWMAVGILGALALAFVAFPLVDAAQDAKHSRRDHVALDWARFLSIGVIVALVVLTVRSGAPLGDVASEAGTFMVPLATAAAFAALGADLGVAWRERNGREDGAGTFHA